MKLSPWKIEDWLELLDETAQRGDLDERWFASTTPADNGPAAVENEGLSFVVFKYGTRSVRFLLREAVEELKASLIGERLWKAHGK